MCYRNLMLALCAMLLPLPVRGESAVRFEPVYGPALPPDGFVQFCTDRPGECVAGVRSDVRLVATPARMQELDEVNRSVNAAIEQASDSEIYGTDEFWTLPETKGDCEDIALLKRHKLIERGWPVRALLITVVLDEKREGHAVLTARLSSGDFILDSKTSAIKLWSETPYRFETRQSYIDPNGWIALDPSYAPAPKTANPGN